MTADVAEAAEHLKPYLQVVVRKNPKADLRQAVELAIRLAADTHDRNTERLMRPVAHGPWADNSAAADAAGNRARVGSMFGGTYDEFRTEAGLDGAS